MNDEHLEAELERLDAQCQRMALEYCELAKAYRRVVKAGDEMAYSIDEVISDNFESNPAAGDAFMLLHIRKWNAAKEGKPSV